MTENMSCDAIDAVLPDYLERTMEPVLRQSAEAHISSCLRCSALVRDLAKIAAEARMLPELVPSRDLWKGIDARIAAPVIPLGAGQAAPRTAPPRRVRPAWMGIAAAALMMSTAGVTYFLTARTLTPARIAAGTAQPAPAVVLPVAESTTAGAVEGFTEPRAGESSDPRSVRPAASDVRPSAAGIETSPAVRPAARGGGVASFASETSQVRDAQTDVVYGREIEMLQRIARSREAQLDSSTVTVIERNLRVIDAAIEQSRAALARDPASGSLSDQLTRVLDKKVKLLRTAALLPAST